MATPLTRQDLMTIMDNTKNSFIQKVITRQDIQTVTDSTRDRILNTVNSYHLENQTLMKQSTNQTDQISRRTVAIEQQITTLRSELRVLTQAVDRLYETQMQQLNRQKTADSSEQLRY